jgi:NADH:ubiquinone reductase (H+-translocating)
MNERRALHRRVAKNGTLIIGGGFAGAHVARLLGRSGATIVSPESSMLYTPLLPEVAAGAIEPRHVYVPLHSMCPDADLVRGFATSLDERWRTVTVRTEVGDLEIEYERLVVALGSTARMLPIPGLVERAIPFKNLGDALYLRNHILRRLDLAELDPDNAHRYLTFVFVGAGYAGVEALAETMQLVQDALRHRRALAGASQRWVLVNAGPRILGEVPDRLSRYAAAQLERQGVEIFCSTTLDSAEDGSALLSDGTRIETDTLVWTAGVVPHPLVRELGLPLDDRGRIAVDSSLQVEGRFDVWALGDCAGVPNDATPGLTDPPTCQHALRQAKALARSLHGRKRAYSYRSLGEGATLGRDKGIMRFRNLMLRGRVAALATRVYHLQAVPLRSRRLRILTDGLLSQLLRRDVVELGTIEPRPALPALPGTDGTAEGRDTKVLAIGSGRSAP